MDYKIFEHGVGLFVWFLLILHFIHFVARSQVWATEGRKFAPVAKPPTRSVDATSGGTRSVDISEMCKIVDIFNDECNTLNKKIYELVNECNELKEQNTSLIRSLQYCHLRMSKSDESTHRRRTRRFMSMPIQTGIGVAFYGTALANEVPIYDRPRTTSVRCARTTFGAASVEDRTLVVSPKRKRPYLVAGSEL